MAADKVVRLATLPDYRPMCFIEPSPSRPVVETLAPGEDSAVLRGYAWDVVRSSYHEQGYTIELHMVPWVRVMHYLRKGVVDAGFPALRTSEREQEFAFSQNRVLSQQLALYSLKEYNIRWTGWQDLEQRRIGVVRAWSNGALDGHAHLPVVCDDTAEALERLGRGNVELVACHGFSCALAQTGIRGDELRLERIVVLGEEPQYVMVPGRSGESGWAAQVFDRGYEQLSGRGEIRRLQEKWGGSMH